MYISRKQKRNISVWIILAVFLLAGVFLFSNLGKKSDPEMAKQLSGSELADGNQVIEDSLSTTLKDYLSDKEGSISDEEMEQIIAQISTGVLNSVPDDFDTSKKMEIRALVADAVNQAVSEKNASSDSSVTYITNTDGGLKQYIDKTIVPRTSALIQVNAGDIDDLKTSLSKSSDAYKSDKKSFDSQIDALSAELSKSSANAEKLESQIQSLNKIFDDYCSNEAATVTSHADEIVAAKQAIDTLRRLEAQDNSDISSLSVRMDAIEADLKTEFENEIAAVKDTLQKQILDSNNLSVAQKEELQKQIEDISVESVQNVDGVKQQLSTYLTSYQSDAAAIGIAIDQLNEGSGSLNEQIKENKNLSDAQKNILTDMINDLGITADSNLESAKNQLIQKNEELNQSLNSAVTDLNGSIDTVRSDLGNLSGTVDTVRTDLGNLSGTVDTVQTDVGNLNGTIATVDSNYKQADQEIWEELNNLSTQVSNLLNTAYPVGSLYISTNNQNPANFLGGKWESYAQGRTIIGAGTGTDSNGAKRSFSAGASGGEYAHTLSNNEMPSHSHSVAGGTYTTTDSGSHQHTGTTDGAGQHSHAYTNAANATIGTIGVDTYITGTAISSINFVTNGSYTTESGWHAHNFTTNASGSHNHNVSIPDKSTSSTGGGQAHNNVQPYITVYIWRRVA